MKNFILKILITFILISLFSNYSYANKEYYTIQAGSYPSIAEAEKEYNILAQRLTDDQRDHLRIRSE